MKKVTTLVTLALVLAMATVCFAGTSVKRSEVQILRTFQYIITLPTELSAADRTIEDGDGTCYLVKVPVKELSMLSMSTLSMVGVDWLDESLYELASTDVHVDLLNKCLWVEFAYLDEGKTTPYVEKGEVRIQISSVRVKPKAALAASSPDTEEVTISRAAP